MKSFGSTKGLLVDCRHRVTAENTQRFWRSRGYSAGEITQYRDILRGPQKMVIKWQVYVWPQVTKKDYFAFINSIQDPPGWIYEGGPNGQEQEEERTGSRERGGQRRLDEDPVGRERSN